MHGVGERFGDVECLVMREVRGAGRRVEIIVAAHHHALIERAGDNGDIARWAGRARWPARHTDFRVDIVYDGLHRGREHIAAADAGVLGKRIHDDSVDPAAAIGVRSDNAQREISPIGIFSMNWPPPLPLPPSVFDNVPWTEPSQSPSLG